MLIKSLKEKLNGFWADNGKKSTPVPLPGAVNYLKNIVNNLPCHVVWKDVNSVFLGCNKKFANSVGLDSPNDIVGMTDYDFPWTDEQREGYLSDDKEIIRTGKPKLNYEETQTQPDGSIRTILISKIPMYDEKRKICGILIIYTDEANYLRDSIIDHLPNHFIFWKDKNSVYLGCNKALATSLGLKSTSDIIGKTDYDLPTTKQESDAYRADDRFVMESKTPKLNIEETQTLADGNKRILSTSKVPLFDKQGQVYGVLAIYSDITQQKLNEQQLIETNKKLEKSYQVKSEFIRNISHDVRTPLTGIQQTARMIAEGKVSEEDIAEYALSAWEASTKLMDLFNQIIDVSKKEYFDFEDRIVKFDLYKLLESLQQTYSVVAKNKKLTLDIEYSEKVPRYLLGKHMRLHRVLMNLLGNALKFTEKGSVRLVVEIAQETDEKFILRFSVIDTGIGIPEEKQSVIFEKFTRLNPSFQNQYPGSGLGLHVVKDYVEKMGGEIYVESEEEKGSMFTCILPFKRPILNNDNDVSETEYVYDLLNQEEPPRINVIKDKKEKKIDTSKSVEKFNVLLVEDTKIQLTLGLANLKDIKDYQIDTAESGEEALVLSEKTPYDIIYMDIGLPGIDGIETVKRIRANPKNLSRHAFITALTAHADEEITKQCLEAGMEQVLTKPLTPEKIQQVHFASFVIGHENEEESIINWSLWLSRMSNNTELMEESFHLLAEEFNNNRPVIIKAFAAKDWPQLKAVTHKMKGALKYCGLPRLEEAMSAIENAAKNADEQEIIKWYQETLDALDEAALAYKNWSEFHPKTK